jgi:hypothetical protein
MNSRCAAAPMKRVSSYHLPTENKNGFSSSEVKAELRGNGTNISDSSLTRSEVFPKLCSKKEDQNSCVSSASQSTTSWPMRRYPVVDPHMVSSQFTFSTPVEEDELKDTNIRKKGTDFCCVS